MSSEAKSVSWLLITLLQKRKLSWPTLSLIESTITDYARASRYSSHAKKNWSDDQWMAFLEEGEQLRDECAASIESFYEDSDVGALNAALDGIRHRLTAMDVAISGDTYPPLPVGMPAPPEAGSVAWLLRMFPGWGPPHPTTRLIMIAAADADGKVFALVKGQTKSRSGDRVQAYDRIYEACEAGIAAFLNNSDRAALNASLEEIRDRLTAMMNLS